MNFGGPNKQVHKQAHSKMKRNAQQNHTRNVRVTAEVMHRMHEQNQHENSVEEDVEQSCRAVERKLIYLSESNHTASLSRIMRPRAPRGAGGGSGEPVASRVNGSRNSWSIGPTVGNGAAASHGNRKKQGPKKCWQQNSYPHQIVTENPTRPSGGHNVLTVESPRRNGLTPRDPFEELEVTPSNSKVSRRMQDVVLAAEREEACLRSKSGGSYGKSRHNKKSLKNSAHGLVREQHPTLPLYKCHLCGAKFNIKSLLVAHRHTHDDHFQVRFAGRRSKESSTTLSFGNRCRFCDRKFELERTLHIHQLSHCKKIPPQHRRKLAFTELAHEKKAPLPNFQRNSTMPNVCESGSAEAVADVVECAIDGVAEIGQPAPLRPNVIKQDAIQQFEKKPLLHSSVSRQERWR